MFDSSWKTLGSIEAIWLLAKFSTRMDDIFWKLSAPSVVIKLLAKFKSTRCGSWQKTSGWTSVIRLSDSLSLVMLVVFTKTSGLIVVSILDAMYSDCRLVSSENREEVISWSRLLERSRVLKAVLRWKIFEGSDVSILLEISRDVS
jgi:hypothetical protein